MYQRTVEGERKRDLSFFLQNLLEHARVHTHIDSLVGSLTAPQLQRPLRHQRQSNMPFRLDGESGGFERRRGSGREGARARLRRSERASERRKAVCASIANSECAHTLIPLTHTCQTMAGTRSSSRARVRETYNERDKGGGVSSAAVNTMMRGHKDAEELLQSLVGSSHQRLSLQVCSADFQPIQC